MGHEPGKYELELNTCLGKITQIFASGENEYKKKIKKMEEERAIFMATLDIRNNLEKQNTELKDEIKLLKEEVSYLQLRSKEDKTKYDTMWKKYQQFREKTAKKQSTWHRFLNTAKKKCKCDYHKVFSHFDAPSAPSTPTVKVKNISNVFFKSPVKPKFDPSDMIALAPMTEDYYMGTPVHLGTPDGGCTSSTPLIVGETERQTPFFLYEVHSSGGEETDDDEQPHSPSLFANHNNDSKLNGETPRTLKVLKTKDVNKINDLNKDGDVIMLDDVNELNNINKLNDVNKKPIGLDTPDVFDFGRKKDKNVETSVELFGDSSITKDSSSIVKTPKDYSNNVKTLKDGKENFNVSDDPEFDFDINFGKQNNAISKDQRAPNKDKDVPYMEQFTPSKEHCKPDKAKYKEQSPPNKGNEIDQRCIDPDYKEISESAPKKSKYTQEKNPPSTKQTNIFNKTNNQTHITKEKENTDGKIETNTDRTNYKFSTVVRKKDERAKLNGYACQDCKRYYQSDNLSDSRLKEVLKHCSRHKHASSPPPSTPEHFWTLDFPPTQDCIDKGYMLDHNTTLPEHAKPKWQKAKAKSKKNMKFD